jgi:hypothetical protein
MYLYRDGAGHQLSRDHTLAQDLVANGVLTPEEAIGHHYAHVLSRAIGTQPAVRVDTLPLYLLPGDRFLLCSDGLADYVPDTAWMAQQMGDGDPESVVDHLVDYANDSGGKDNVTVVLVHVEGDEVDAGGDWITGVTLRMAALRKVPLFDNLTLRQHAVLMSLCRDATYEPGAVLATEGDALDRMTMVISGELSVTRGDGIEVDRLGPGTSLGATALVSPRRARASVRAVDRVRVLELERDEFVGLVRRRPYVGVKLLTELGTRLNRELDWALSSMDLVPGGPAQLV